MNEWKECKLGEIIKLKRGFDLPHNSRIEGSFPIISSSGISGNHNEFRAKGPGVVTGRYGTIGEVFYTEKDYWPHNTTLFVENFFGNFPKYIFYFLKSFDFFQFSDKSAVPGINRNDVHKANIKIPPLLEQRTIATILSSLDDKIDLLHRQNKTLEQLAETVFRQYFIENNEGFEIDKIGRAHV